ncbi:MAG: hypothetical protein AB1649_16190 [Chloroflexota bacterium]
MKRFFEILLLLPIILALIYIAVGYQNGTIIRWFSASTPVSAIGLTPWFTSTPTIASSAIPYRTSTGVVTANASAVPVTTSAPTFVVLPPATKTAPPTRTNTALPTATKTSRPTNTPPVSPTATPLSQEMEDGVLAGNQVVRAIEDYYLNEGKYPTSLLDLVPSYLPGLPVSPAGQPFLYRLFEANSPLATERYWLSFRVSDQQNLTCTYMRRIEYWDCNTSSP